MKTTRYCVMVWVLEELLQKFICLDTLLDKALISRDRTKYMEIIRKKANALTEAANHVSQIAEGKEEKRLEEVICNWAYGAQKFLLLPEINNVDEVLTQQGKNQLKFFVQL